MYSTRHKRLDKPNIISTYTALEIRRIEPFKNERKRWLHGWRRVLLLPEIGIREKNGNQSLNYRYRPISYSTGTGEAYEMILYSYYIPNCEMMFYF